MTDTALGFGSGNRVSASVPGSAHALSILLSLANPCLKDQSAEPKAGVQLPALISPGYLATICNLPLQALYFAFPLISSCTPPATSLSRRTICFKAPYLLGLCLVMSHSEPVSSLLKAVAGDFPGGAVVGNPPAKAGDTGSSPGPGRSHMPRSN